MPLTPAAPNPITPFLRFLIKGTGFLWGLGDQLNDYIGVTTAPADLEWRKVVLVFTRATPALTAEDTAQFAFNIVNITGADIDTSWTTGDYTTCETALDAFFTAIRARIDADHTLKEYRWYRMRFANPMALDHRFEDSGPPERVTLKGLAGTGTGSSLPYQVAASITLRTSVPRHWGRVYVPGLPSGELSGASGRWGSTTMSTLANAGAELVDALGDSEFQLVVPVTQVDNVLQPGMLGVTEVVVDDIPDVIRRRRARQPAVKQLGVPT